MTIRNWIDKKMHPNRHSSEAYITYLRKNGATIGEGTFFYAPKSNVMDDRRLDYITIGKNCSITQGCQILCHDFSWSVLRKSHNEILPDPGQEVVIGDNVFLGWNTIVLGGVHIGSNVIIGANSVVTHDVPDNMVYAGNPARQICTLEDYYIKRKENELVNAFARAKHIHDKTGRDPYSEEMGWFGVLWLERDNKNEEYLRKLGMHGDSIDEVIKAFYAKKPIYEGFEAFLKDARDYY